MTEKEVKKQQTAKKEVKKQYTIGGVKYTQTELVLGQHKLLAPYLEKIAPKGKLQKETDIEDIINMVAIIVYKEGEAPIDKNINETRTVIESNVTMSLATEILQDFFTLNSMPTLPEDTEKEKEELEK